MNEAPPDLAPAAAPDEVAPRILWLADAPWIGTGYGTQSALFGWQIQKQLGYEVAFAAFPHGLRGARLPWVAPDQTIFTVYPGGRDGHSNDVIGSHAKHYHADLVISLTDPWVIAPTIAAKLPWAAWIPVDQEPLIPDTDNWLKMSGAVPIAMSRYGERLMQEAGHHPLYVPHGFDSDLFFPRDRAQSRKIVSLPQSAFIVGMVAANLGNPGRKCFGEAIKAFSIFQERHPDALLYLHTRIEDPKGVDIPYLCEENGVFPRVSDQYGLTLGTPPAFVALLHNSFDVLLNPARGEGFGVPLIEAQACGTPCIVTNASAMPEVAPAPANWHINGQDYWSNFRGKMKTPSIEEIVNALEEAYAESAVDRTARRAAVCEHAAAYEAVHVTKTYWPHVLEQAPNRIAWSRQRMLRHDR